MIAGDEYLGDCRAVVTLPPWKPLVCRLTRGDA